MLMEGSSQLEPLLGFSKHDFYYRRFAVEPFCKVIKSFSLWASAGSAYL